MANESVATASSQEARAADTHGSALGGGRHGAPRARAVLGGLIESDDEFCLQLDVPAKARERWDVELLAAWGHAQNEYVCDRRCRRKQHVIEAPSQRNSQRVTPRCDAQIWHLDDLCAGRRTLWGERQRHGRSASPLVSEH